MLSTIILFTIGLFLSALLCLAKTKNFVLQRAKNGDVEAMIMLAEGFEHFHYARLADGITYKYTNSSKVIPEIREMQFRHNKDLNCDVWYRRADKKGHKDALFCLARFYNRIQKQELALPLYKEAAGKGHSGAQYELALLSLAHPADMSDYEIYEPMKNAAEGGHIEAQYKLARMYLFGDWVPYLDLQEARKWFKKAAAGGHKQAGLEGYIAELVNSAEEGKDISEVLNRIGQPGSHDYFDAIAKGIILAESSSYLKAEQSLQELFFNQTIGKYLPMEVQGVSELEKLNWQATALQDPQAFFDLGQCHYHGIGLSRNLFEAYRHYQIAAELGHPQAAFELGDCLWFKEGTAVDEAAAQKWYKAAAELGSEDARQALEAIRIREKSRIFELNDYFNPRRIDIQAAELNKLIKQAKAKDQQARFELAVRYYHGYGVPKDPKESYYWLEQTDKESVPLAYYFRSKHFSKTECSKETDLILALYSLENIDKKDPDNAEAWYQLGKLYAECYNDQEDSPEIQKAIDYLTKAAKMGHPGAQYLLYLYFGSGMYMYGNIDNPEAWLKEAAKNGDLEALAEYSDEFPNQKDRLFYCQQAAERGHAKAQLQMIGLLFDNQDYAAVDRWLKIMSYAKGEKKPMQNYFSGYHSGGRKGVLLMEYLFPSVSNSSDPPLDVYKWLRRMAEIMKEAAQKVQDFDERNLWLRSNSDHVAALFEQGYALETGSGVEQNHAQAYELYRQAGALGHPEALFRLGVMFYLDLAVKMDEKKAHALWRVAADKGHKVAGLCCQVYESHHHTKDSPEHNYSDLEGLMAYLDVDTANAGEPDILEGFDYEWDSFEEDYEDEEADEDGVVAEIIDRLEFEHVWDDDNDDQRHGFVDLELIDLDDDLPLTAAEKDWAHTLQEVRNVMAVCQAFQEANNGNEEALKEIGAYYASFNTALGEAADEDGIEDLDVLLTQYNTGNLMIRVMTEHCKRIGGLKAACQMAESWYIPAAIGDSIEARRALGEMYIKAEYVPRDTEKAFRWKYRCLGFDDPGVCTRLGDELYNSPVQYGTEIFVTSPRRKPDEFYQLPGMYYLPRQAMNWYQKAADKGDAYAQYAIGRMYHFGLEEGLDIKAAFAWYLKSAEQKFAPVEYKLAKLYRQGIGCEKDEAVALTWLQKSADHGYPFALYLLSKRYEEGDGVEADQEKAQKYLEMAYKACKKKTRQDLDKFISDYESRKRKPFPER